MADEQLIKPRELPPAIEVYDDDAIMTDDGSTVSKATPVQIVNAGSPVASEAEAIAGTNNTNRMTPLRVRQVLDDTTAPSVLRAQAWAESPTNPDPSIPGSQSAKTWAGIAEDAAAVALSVANELVPLSGRFYGDGVSSSFSIPSEYSNRASITLVVGGVPQSVESYQINASSGSTTVTWLDDGLIPVPFSKGMEVHWRSQLRQSLTP